VPPQAMHDPSNPRDANWQTSDRADASTPGAQYEQARFVHLPSPGTYSMLSGPGSDGPSCSADKAIGSVADGPLGFLKADKGKKPNGDWAP
jgi:hypothetical protein